MTDSELFQKSQGFKKQADLILRDSRLTEALSKYGVVRFTGSYPLDVMMRPDLDVYATARRNSKEKMLEVVHDIFSTLYFEEIRFANYVDFHKDQNDHKGYYIQPHIQIGSSKWKLDIWLMTEDRYESHTERFLKLLSSGSNSQEKRLLILKLKDHYREGQKYKAGINGKIIYEAVLENGVRNVGEFEEYLERNHENF